MTGDTGPDIVALRHISAQLDDNPLFHMSLGSKELFHSNFLAWVVQQEPDIATSAFGEWALPDRRSASVSGPTAFRERHKLDLVIELPGRVPLVIENKAFKLPHESQLSDYTPIVAKHLPGASCVLLSLIPPAFELPIGWVHRNYEDLADGLERALHDESSRVPFNRELIECYVAFIRSLVALVAAVSIREEAPPQPSGGVIEFRPPTHDEPYLLSTDVISLLNRHRVADIALKVRAQQLLTLILNGERMPVMGRAATNFTNKTAIVEMFMETDVPEEWVGWQLQDGDFRLVAERRFRGADTDHREALKRHDPWFDFELLYELCHTSETETVPKKSSMSDPDHFNKFAKDGGLFLYRFRRPKNLTVDQVVQLGVAYARMANTYVYELSVNEVECRAAGGTCTAPRES